MVPHLYHLLLDSRCVASFLLLQLRHGFDEDSGPRMELRRSQDESIREGVIASQLIGSMRTWADLINQEKLGTKQAKKVRSYRKGVSYSEA